MGMSCAQHEELRREALHATRSELEARLQRVRRAVYEAETALQTLRHEVEVLEGVAAERGMPLVWSARQRVP
jgi:hypothetical protein